jgi:hypothetical protein
MCNVYYLLKHISVLILTHFQFKLNETFDVKFPIETNIQHCRVKHGANLEELFQFKRRASLKSNKKKNSVSFFSSFFRNNVNNKNNF